MVMELAEPLADRSTWRPTECSIAKTMDVIGSRSAMLVIREALYGTTRFDEFARRVGVTDAAMASRLKQLVGAGILEKRPYREAGKRTRYEYVLTAAGEDLLPVLLSLMQWGDRHLQEDGGPLDVVERDSGEAVSISPHTGSGRELAADQLVITPNRRWLRKHHRRDTTDR